MDDQTNNDRADRAEAAMAGYDEMQDLLSDLMHLADRKESKQLENFWDALRMAVGHYACEIDPNDDISPGTRLGSDWEAQPVGMVEVQDDEPGNVSISIPMLAGLTLRQRTFPTSEGVEMLEDEGTVLEQLPDGGKFTIGEITITH